MRATHSCVCADLYFSIATSTNDHPIDFVEGDKVVNFTLFVAVLINRVDNEIRLLYFGKSDQEIVIVIDVDAVRHFGFTILTFEHFPGDFSDQVDLGRTELNCEPLFQAIIMTVLH